MTSLRTLYDGTPIPEDLDLAHREATAMVYEASRVGVALRALGDVLGNEDEPVRDDHRPGLCEAVGLVGECLERYALDRLSVLEHFSREREMPAEPRKAPKRQGVAQ